MALVEVHHLAVHALRVVLVHLLYGLHLRLDLLHHGHGLVALEAQRREEDLDDDAQDDDGYAVISRELVEVDQRGVGELGQRREEAEIHGAVEAEAELPQHGEVLGTEIEKRGPRNGLAGAQDGAGHRHGQHGGLFYLAHFLVAAQRAGGLKARVGESGEEIAVAESGPDPVVLRGLVVLHLFERGVLAAAFLEGVDGLELRLVLLHLALHRVQAGAEAQFPGRQRLGRAGGVDGADLDGGDAVFLRKGEFLCDPDGALLRDELRRPVGLRFQGERAGEGGIEEAALRVRHQFHGGDGALVDGADERSGFGVEGVFGLAGGELDGLLFPVGRQRGRLRLGGLGRGLRRRAGLRPLGLLCGLRLGQPLLHERVPAYVDQGRQDYGEYKIFIHLTSRCGGRLLWWRQGTGS